MTSAATGAPPSAAAPTATACLRSFRACLSAARNAPPLLVEELFALIARIHADGVAVLLVEQNVVQSLEIASRAYILAEGQCVISGLSADIGADPQLKRAYLGL